MDSEAAINMLAHQLREKMGPIAQDFDAKGWIETWIDLPLRSLNGKCPRDYLGSESGVLLIADLLVKLHRSSFMPS